MRQLHRHAKGGVRAAARNYQVASAVFRKVDITGGRRRKRDAEEREERRRWLLGQKKKDEEEDTTADAQAHPLAEREREFFIDSLLVRIHFIIMMIRWTGLAPLEFEFPFRRAGVERAEGDRRRV